MEEPNVVNLAGGSAYQESARLELLGLLLTSHVDNQAYRSRQEFIRRVQHVVSNIEDKRFVAKAVVLARTHFGQRSTTHLAAAVLAKLVKGESWMGKFLQDVVFRPDDITEIIAAYTELYGFPLPNMFKQKRGLSGAFQKFGYYHFAKYQEKGRAFRMIDAVNLLHPKPSKKNSQALSDLVKDKLEPPETWEVKLTQAGSNAEAKAEAWEQLILDEKLGYMALLMNLRNISSQAAKVLPAALKQLTNPDLIKKSLVLPYQFFQAHSALSQSQGVADAIEEAAQISLSNVPTLPGKTLIALDVSGSMFMEGGKPFKTGSMFAAVLAKANDADLLVFATTAEYIPIDPSDGIFTIVEKIKNANTYGGGTDFNAIFRVAREPYDRIIVLSDMQGYIDGGTPIRSFQQWKVSMGINPLVWSFNLQDCGSLMFPIRDVFCVAGWSDKILDIMTSLETDRDALLNLVESVEFKGVNG